jgi:hypothetical protein
VHVCVQCCLCAVHVCVHVCVQCCPCAVHVCVQCCVLCMSVCARFCCKAIMSNSMFSGALAQTHPHAGFKESSFPICVLCFGHVATASSVILATSPGSKQTCSPAYTCVLYVCFNIAYVGHPPPFRSVAVQGPAQHTALWQASCTALRQPWGHVLWRVHWAGRWGWLRECVALNSTVPVRHCGSCGGMCCSVCTGMGGEGVRLAGWENLLL